MIHRSQLNYILPSRFLGLIPLYIGVEIILGIAIINKAGGAYGILSVITFHPINFWQWLYFLLAIIILPFYISGLTNLKNKENNSRKMSLSCLIYIADTICGFLYTLYFMYFWFSNEDTAGSDGRANENIRAYDSSSVGVDKSLQSASQTREMFFIITSTIVISVLRLYSTLVIMSFTKALLKQELNENNYTSSVTTSLDEFQSNTSNFTGKIKFYLHKIELKSKELLINFFN